MGTHIVCPKRVPVRRAGHFWPCPLRCTRVTPSPLRFCAVAVRSPCVSTRRWRGWGWGGRRALGQTGEVESHALAEDHKREAAARDVRTLSRRKEKARSTRLAPLSQAQIATLVSEFHLRDEFQVPNQSLALVGCQRLPCFFVGPAAV